MGNGLSRGRFLSSELNAAVVEPARAEGVDKALAGCLYSLGQERVPIREQGPGHSW